MYSKHNGDNTKLKIFSSMPQQQRIQPNFMNDSIRTFIHTKQLNTRTTRTTKTTMSTWISLETKIYALLRQRKFCSIHIQTLQEIGRFRTFHPSQTHFIEPKKSVLGLLSNFVHFIHPYMNPLPKKQPI